MQMNNVTHGTQLMLVKLRSWIIEIQRMGIKFRTKKSDKNYSGDLTIKKSPVASRSDSNTVTLKITASFLISCRTYIYIYYINNI